MTIIQLKKLKQFMENNPLCTVKYTIDDNKQHVMNILIYDTVVVIVCLLAHF